MSSHRFIFNDKLCEGKEISVSFSHRGLNYGDGLFETLIFRRGLVRFWPYHTERLLKGMEVLGLRIPEPDFFKNTERLLRTMLAGSDPYRDVVLKLLIIRHEGGLYAPKSRLFDLLLYEDRTPREPLSLKKNIFFSKTVRLSHHPLSNFKTCSALPYVLAGMEREKVQADDLVLLDTYGHVAECTASNLFWIKDEKIFTPDLHSGCIEGIMRRNTLEACKKLSVPYEEVLADEEILLEADFVFTSNVSGLVPVQRIEETKFSDEHKVFKKLRDLLS